MQMSVYEGAGRSIKNTACVCDNRQHISHPQMLQSCAGKGGGGEELVAV